MSNPELAAQLSTLLQQQQESSAELRTLLEQERDLLLNGSPEAMMTLLQSKEELAKKMAAVQGQLISIAAQHNHPQTDLGLIDCILDCDSDGSLQQQWNALLSTAEECKKLNEINGATINLKKRHTENSLAILRGQITNHAASVYSKKGVESSNQGSRFIHKA